MTTRKFYKTIVQVTILSEDKVPYINLESIAYGINEGDYSGNLDIISTKELNGKEAAHLFKAIEQAKRFRYLKRKQIKRRDDRIQ